MADLEISKLPPIAGALLQATDPLPLADLSASETKRITVKDLIQSGIALIDSGSIPPDKLSYTVPPNSVGALQLKTQAVTAAKLADNSVVVVGAALPATGDYIGQLGLNTSTSKLSVWTGSAWESLKAAGSVNTLTGGTFGPLTTAVVQLGDTATITAKADNSTAPGQFLAGPAATAGAVSLRGITSEDLPRASTVVVGGVSVPVGSGLTIDGGPTGLAASLKIDNSTTASGTAHLVTYDAHGLVTGGRPIAATDLPLATTGSSGAIAAGTEFSVPPSGVLQHRNQITAGSGAKVNFDGQGHITSVAALLASDIPNLDAAKLVSGTLLPSLIGNRSISQEQLKDYSISFIQEAAPPSANNYHNGMLWFQESTGQLRMWNGNSWFAVGFGRLSAENLRYCGVFDATTGLITGVTQFGTIEGLHIGDPIPTASDAKAGVYFVCSKPGNGVPLTPATSYDAGDWILCNGATGNWVRIDTLNGAGGAGAGAVHLDDLLDVTLTTPAAGDILQFNAAGQWVNVAFTDAGTY